jgi:hypothetical protein
MKKIMNEQSMGALMTGGSGSMWYEKFGCIVEGVDGLKKVQTANGTEFEHTGKKGRTILYNDEISTQKPNPELVKKVLAVNPKIKHFGKGFNFQTKEEVVFYCTGPVRGGIRVIGKNDTVDPAPAPKTPAQTPKTVNRPLWNKAPETSAAPVNEQFENKVLSEQIIRIKDVMGKLL